jgi:8-oxo-dGTP pyrophosphatase MutT (NUDIX family)
MQLLGEIFRRDVDITGKTVHRNAVRGIIVQNATLLMIYSPKNGDYKFPGGGVDRGESYQDALIREIREECGATVAHIEREFGCVVEYDQAVEPEYGVFKMTSHYYVCHVEHVFGEQNLDDYEDDLGFEPVWIGIDEAIKINEAVMNSPCKQAPRWTKRDTFVLEQVKASLLLS